ncbi:MAG: hypothetical protein HS111_40000 [Kofleriaceae bacterium]|nr:hypothetical protein [Kofleriaceae bacterium]MCL4228262.1 hypothetical protein [Myxococcales bacterium]
MSKTLAAIVLIAGLAGGCVVHGRGAVAVTATTPDLVMVAPGVHVIAGYDEPIFYVDGLYWWYLDGYWYRSDYYTRGWVYVAAPPAVIIGIHQPYRYRHYRPHGHVVRNRPVPAHRIERPQVRDHRTPRGQVRDRRR